MFITLIIVFKKENKTQVEKCSILLIEIKGYTDWFVKINISQINTSSDACSTDVLVHDCYIAVISRILYYIQTTSDGN